MPATRFVLRVNAIAIALAAVALLGASARGAGRPGEAGQPFGQVPSVSTAPTPQGPVLLVVVLDAQGQPVRTLRAADFEVTVDGFRRSVLRSTYVFRGPGAEQAARRALGATPDLALAEPARTVVVAVDETTLPRGSEKAAAGTVRAILDRLGPSDRVAVVRLPQVEKTLVATTDRAPALEALRRLSGRASPDQRNLREKPLAPMDGEGPLPTRFATPSDDSASADPAAALAALPRLLDRMGETPGPKTLVVVATGQASVQAGARDETRRADAAAAAQTVVHVLLLPGAAGRSKAGPLDRLAAESGGSVFDLDRSPERRVDQLITELGGFYALSLEPASQGSGAVSDVRVVTRPTGLRTVAAVRWAPRGVLRGVVEIRPSAAAAPAPAAPRAGAPTDRAAAPPPRDAELDLVVARATEYVQSYVRDFTRVVAEEEYDQRLEYPTNSIGVRPADGHRVVRSDVLMVSTPDLGRWLPFRDVFEADGKKVRDREDRLRKLFVDAPTSAASDARRITEESARYNLGSVDRTINVPTLALECLFPAALPRFRLERRGEESIDGVRAWRIDYEERTGPTLIRTPGGGNVPASGSFWVDPVTGRVLRTVLRTGDQAMKMAITVEYRGNDELGLWVPSEMRERYERQGETLTAVARYSNFRRFRVSTTEDIKVP